MTDPGLTRRLRQQGHRSGLAIGISMALAIAVLIGGFTWIYVQLDPFVRDFAGAEPAPTQTPVEQASGSGKKATKTPTPEESADEPAQEPDATETPKPESTWIQSVQEDNGDFKPDYQVVALEPVRLRSGPGVNFDIVIDGVAPGTKLQYLDDREDSQNPDADGDTEWLKFRLEGGEEGWIRQIDVGET
jgi:SH3 domain-containing protein